MSRDKNAYTVNVYEWDYAGDVVTLTGASEPFVTQEDDDTDIFTPVRTQTGYLRVIDTTGGKLLEEMMPANNTEKPVRLMLGDTVCWQGFLAAQGYSQPWDNHKNKIEFQVISLLAALEYISAPTTYVGKTYKLSQLMGDAIDVMSKGDLSIFSIVSGTVTDMTNVRSMLDYALDFSTFIDKEEVINEGLTTKVKVGNSYKDCIEAVCQFLGVSLRESGNTLLYSRYDEGNSVIRYKLPDVSGGLATNNLLDAVDFRGASNTTAYSQGAKVVKVTLSLPSIDTSFGIPSVETTSDKPTVINLLYGYYKLYVQEHTPVDTSEATYQFYEYNWNTGTYIGTSNYTDFISRTVLHGYTPDPWSYPESDAKSHLFTGAFPVRFYNWRSETDIITLKDGIYFNTQYQNAGALPDISISACRPVVTFNSVNSINMSSGYLRFSFSLLNLFYAAKTYFTDSDYSNVLLDQHINQKSLMIAVICCGKYWSPTGSKWVDDETTFEISFDGDKMQTNYTSDMRLDTTDGYFIPVSGMTGTVQFVVYDMCIINADGYWQPHHCYTHIIYDLEVEYLEDKNITAGSRSSNTYRRELTTNGFADTKVISLSVGTNNNNTPVPCFILDPITGDKVQKFDYINIDGTSEERPELHLLNRMAIYYNEVRRSLRATIHSGLDLMLARYEYNNRLYFGVDAQHNWRDDTQEVKFIEAQTVAGDDETVIIKFEDTVYSFPDIDGWRYILSTTMIGKRKDMSENFNEKLFSLFDWSFQSIDEDYNASFDVGTLYTVKIECDDLFTGDPITASVYCVSKTPHEGSDKTTYLYKFSNKLTT